jgi:hypothetical protein
MWITQHQARERMHESCTSYLLGVHMLWFQCCLLAAAAAAVPVFQALHSLGFRVVLDVVYNHTFASGPYSSNSVLDKIVPGYYHRRQEDGEICHSTCCNSESHSACGYWAA